MLSSDDQTNLTPMGESQDPYRVIYLLRAVVIPNDESSPNFLLG